MTGRDPVEGVPRKEGRGLRFWILLVAAALLLVIVLQNGQEVEVKLLFIETTAPLIIALLIAGALGALIGWAWPHVRRGRRAEREHEKRK
jgi:uncharacterized integral membrane protein